MGAARAARRDAGRASRRGRARPHLVLGRDLGVREGGQVARARAARRDARAVRPACASATRRVNAARGVRAPEHPPPREASYVAPDEAWSACSPRPRTTTTGVGASTVATKQPRSASARRSTAVRARRARGRARRRRFRARRRVPARRSLAAAGPRRAHSARRPPTRPRRATVVAQLGDGGRGVARPPAKRARGCSRDAALRHARARHRAAARAAARRGRRRRERPRADRGEQERANRAVRDPNRVRARAARAAQLRAATPYPTKPLTTTLAKPQHATPSARTDNLVLRACLNASAWAPRSRYAPNARLSSPRAYPGRRVEAAHARAPDESRTP